MDTIKFKQSKVDSFYPTLRKRVTEYFKEKNISQNGNMKLWFKTGAIFAFYLAAYFLMIFEVFPLWVTWILCGAMGAGFAFIGMCVQHDANHGSYSKNKKVNRLLGYSMNLIGGNRFNWIVQHNQKHHTYTNVYGHDDDLDTGIVIRLSPHAKWRPFHKFQQFYSWILYFMTTLMWAVFKEYIHYSHHRKYAENNKKYREELYILMGTTIFYFGYLLLVPMLVMDITFIQWLIGFLTMHAVAGFILAVVFQMAHVVDGTKHLPEDTKEIDTSWAIHQLQTTSNFARKNKVVSWFVGGLNFQVEHHLFPSISHVHYPEIAKIVKKTAEEHGLKYLEYKTFGGAIKAHYRSLKEFGKKPKEVTEESLIKSPNGLKVPQMKVPDVKVNTRKPVHS